MWLLLTAACTEAWSICPGNVPKSKAQGDQHKDQADLTPFLSSQGALHSPGSKDQTSCLMGVGTGLAKKELTSTFLFALHESLSFPGAIATNLGIARINFQDSSIF